MFYKQYVLGIALLLYVGAIPMFSQEHATMKSTSEDQVTQVERDWLAADAKGDTPALRRIILDDFLGSSFDGSVLSKEDIIPEGTAPGGFAGATLGVTNVRVFGDTGVLMGVIKTGG